MAQLFASTVSTTPSLQACYWKKAKSQFEHLKPDLQYNGSFCPVISASVARSYEWRVTNLSASIRDNLHQDN